MKESFVVALFLLPALTLESCHAVLGGDVRSVGQRPGDDGLVTVENCGLTFSYAQPPERAVSLNQHATEVMLALGLEEKMVGTAYVDDEILPEYQDAYEKIPVLADQYPSLEQFLAVEPDFVYGGFPSAFSDEGVGTQLALLELDIDSYLTSGNCRQDGHAFIMEDIYTDLRNLGRIFGISNRAEGLVGEMEAELATLRQETRNVEDRPRVFLYDSGAEAPYTAGCCGTAGLMITLAGGENLFSDTDGNWASVSWEEVIARKPDVIVLIEADWSTAAQKQEFMNSDPALRELKAVRQERYMVLPFSETTAGVRLLDGVRRLAEGFYPDTFE